MFTVRLFRLYNSIKDFDALRGIFSSQIGTQSITKEALEAEARGDYTKALALYSDVSNFTERMVIHVLFVILRRR